MVTNAFCFILKALFIVEILSYVEKLLDKKAMLNFKIYDVANWKKINTIHFLRNISRSKGNQTTQFSQLIKQNMRNHT